MISNTELQKILHRTIGTDTRVLITSNLDAKEVLSLDFTIDFAGDKCKLSIEKSEGQNVIVNGTGVLAKAKGAEIIITFGRKNANQIILLLTDDAGQNIFANIDNGPAGFIFSPNHINPSALDAKLHLVAFAQGRYICVLGKSNLGSKQDMLLTLRYNELSHLSEAYEMLLLAADIDIRNIHRPSSALLLDCPVTEKLIGVQDNG